MENKDIAEKITKMITEIGDIDPSTTDLLEITGILLGDVADMYLAKDGKEFYAQKKDCAKTVKRLKKLIARAYFKDTVTK